MSRHLGDWRDTSGVSRAGILSARRYVGITILWLNLYVPFDECLLSDWASNFQTHSNRSIKASALAICTGHLVTGQSYQDNIPLTVNEVNCTGDEATLSNCSVIYPASNCSSGVGAGVSCYSSMSSVNYINALTQISSYSFSRLAPNSPTNVEITGIDSYSIRVTWLPPDMNCTDVDEYRIICYSSCYIIPTVENTSHSLNTTIQYSNSVDSCVFSCCVSGNNSAGVGPQNCVLGRECLYNMTFVYVI